MRKLWLQNFVSNNVNTTRAFYTHPKILVAAMNGPAVGLSAALLAHADFVYAAPHAYLLTPFTSLGLVAEGGASRALMQRLGPARGAEALYMSKRITCDEMVQAGFVNRVFDCKPGDSDAFLAQVVAEVKDRLGPHLNPSSITNMKKLIRRPDVEAMERVGVEEAMEGLERFAQGYPQEEFRKLATGEKKHKL
jgi:Delta3-Delta2-enoyl-CoA isomerase